MRSSQAAGALSLGLLVAGLVGGTSAVAQSPAASPSPKAATSNWVRVDAPLLETVDTIEHAATSGTEVVAIGTRCDPEGVCGRISLGTSDGLAWEERGPLPAEVDLVGELIVDDGALVAVGRAADGVGAIWRSADAGATWDRVGGRAAFRPGAGGQPRRSPSGNPYEVTILSVATGPGGLVAGGWLNSEDDDRSAVWRATDASTWERVPLPRSMARAGGIFDIAAGAESYVAATPGGVWRSDDGRRWEHVPSGDDDGPVTDVEATVDGFIGMTIGPPVAAVWEAAGTGSVWQRRPDDAALAGLWEAELRALGPRVVAVGSQAGEELVPIVWVLEPSAAWVAESVTDEPGVRVEDVATSGVRLLVVGNAPDTGGTSTGAAWLRDAPAG